MPRLPVLLLLLGVALGVPAPAADAQDDAAAEHPVARPAAQSRGEALADGLRRQLEAATQLELGSGDPFLALWQPAASARPRGVLIILPGEGETADWPRAIAPLRRGLAGHGWHTLSLTPADPPPSPGPRPPQPASMAPAQSTEAASATSESAAPPASPQAEATGEDDPPPAANGTEALPDATPPGHAERMQARLAAAVAHAQAQQAPVIILLGHGTGAYWASRYLAQARPDDVDRLIVVDPRTPATAERPLEAYLATLALAIGDFHTGDRPVARQQAMQRRDAMRRAGHADYRQVALPNLQGDRHADQQQLLRRVRGWLEGQPPR